MVQLADPVAKTNKRNHAQRSDTTVTFDESADQTIDIASLRSGIGKTGVHLRFYKKKEFDKLPADQRNELKAWRQTPEGKAAAARDRAEKEKVNGEGQIVEGRRLGRERLVEGCGGRRT